MEPFHACDGESGREKNPKGRTIPDLWHPVSFGIVNEFVPWGKEFKANHAKHEEAKDEKGDGEQEREMGAKEVGERLIEDGTIF